MRWPASLLIGAVTGVITAVAGGFAAQAGMEWQKVSNMEGAQGFALVFLFIPLSFLGGLAVGTLVARNAPDQSLGGGLGRLGISIAISLGIVLLVLGITWINSDHAPLIDGRELVLEYEIRLPPGFPVQDSLEENGFRVGLVVSSSDRAFTTVDFARVARAGGFLVVPGRGSLNSVGMRTFSVNHGPFEAQKPSQSLQLPLAPKPSRKDFEWSAWLELSRYMDRGEIPPAQRAQMRYRVQFADSTGG